jgi:hypothetical protein
VRLPAGRIDDVSQERALLATEQVEHGADLGRTLSTSVDGPAEHRQSVQNDEIRNSARDSRFYA